MCGLWWVARVKRHIAVPHHAQHHNNNLIFRLDHGIRSVVLYTMLRLLLCSALIRATLPQSDLGPVLNELYSVRNKPLKLLLGETQLQTSYRAGIRRWCLEQCFIVSPTTQRWGEPTRRQTCPNEGSHNLLQPATWGGDDPHHNPSSDGPRMYGRWLFLSKKIHQKLVADTLSLSTYI